MGNAYGTHYYFTIIGNGTPTFSLLDEERLDYGNSEKIPNISVTFPDGYSDTFVLNHFYNSKDDTKLNGRCHYLGHLANEKDACVAMTGCFGSEDVEFTIMSSHGSESNLFKWNKDGSVEHIKHQVEV